jgi:hypothetical protein
MFEYKNITFGILLVALLVNSFSVSGKKTVLFDEHHGQLFKTEKTGELQLSGLAAIFKKEGWEVKTCNSEITDEVLSEIDALIITGAFKPITISEIGAINRFIDKGGKLSVMLHIGSPFAKLLQYVNVSISNGVMHEVSNTIDNNDLDFKVLDLKQHDLFNNLKHFNLYGGWALMPIKENGDKKPDAQQAFGTIVVGSVGKGHFVVFADDAIFQNRFLKDENYLLGKNLANWLKK